MKDSIADKLGMKALTRAVLDEEMKEVVRPEPVSVEFDVVEPRTGDYQFARENIKKLIALGTYSVEEMSRLASMSQNPEMYEALASLLRTTIKANRDLVEIEKVSTDIDVKRDVRRSTEAKMHHSVDGTQQQVTNNLFVGSTKELQDMINAMKGKK